MLVINRYTLSNSRNYIPEVHVEKNAIRKFAIFLTHSVRGNWHCDMPYATSDCKNTIQTVVISRYVPTYVQLGNGKG